ncbi:hypothetical protein J5X84_37555 [Streptosporangiaceae bacterium NEAU-GS5]|nr:hypothetical protein [Streptosporangiaceae bacterium NEAU-GS5]
MELIVVHDDVSVIGRAGCREVELLGWDVAVAPGPFDLGGIGGSGHRHAAGQGAIYGLLEVDGHEDPQIDRAGPESYDVGAAPPTPETLMC